MLISVIAPALYGGTAYDLLRTEGAHDGAVDDGLLTARLHRRSLQRRHDVADVELDDVLQLVVRAVEGAADARKLAASRVLLDLQRCGMQLGGQGHRHVVSGC